MAACGSLDHIFEKPLSENPTFFDSLSPWKHTKSIDDSSSFTELFGELHFKDSNLVHHHNNSTPSPSSPSSSSSSTIDYSEKANGSKTSYYHPTNEKKNYRHSDSFSSMNSESLSLCTEGLGFESFDDVDDLFKNDSCNNEWRNQERRSSLMTEKSAHQNENCENVTKRSSSRTSCSSRGEFPPPISCIGRSGKPWVCFKSYREDGRFILKEVRIPTQEFLHACRENGRLKLRFIQSDDEVIDGDEDDDNDEEENQDILKNDSN